MVAFTGTDLPASAKALRSPLRSAPTGDTEAILSYYRSTAVHGVMSDTSSLLAPSSGPSSTSASPVAFHSRSVSSTSITTQSSSSAYSSESSKARATAPSSYRPPQTRPASPLNLNGPARRQSIPSEGSADRRRIAIVEMSTHVDEYPKSDLYASTSPSSDLYPQRGRETQLGSLALVAPPDASPRTLGFTHSLTSPVQTPSIQSQPFSSPTPPHVRSLPETVRVSGRDTRHFRKSSREVAVVGTMSLSTKPSDQGFSSLATEALKPPLFQTPRSRSPSPGTPEASDSGSSTAPPKSRQRKDALFPSVSPIKELKETLSPPASPMPAPVVMPRIGESKSTDNCVASPVIVNILPELSTPVNGKHIMNLSPKTSTATPATPYLHYQPGLHAKAGPLPPPPMSVFSIDPSAPPPPRPPRHQPLKKKGDMDAVKQALALPPSVAAALKTRILLTEAKEERGATPSINSPPSEAVKELAPTSSTSSLGLDALHPMTSEHRLEEPKFQPDVSDHKKDSELPKTPAHIREGAFPLSCVCTTDSNSNLTVSPDQTIVPLPRHESMDDLVATVGHAIDDMGIIRSSDVPPPTILEPLRHNENRGNQSGLDIRRISLTPTPPLDDDDSAESENRPEVLPPLPAKNEPLPSDSRIRSALSIKRFSSLPRTPSPISLIQPPTEIKRSSRTPSPSFVHHSVPKTLPPVQKVKSAWPAAMHFADVAVKKNALDRSVGYAQKINELYMYDCGLGDWIVETRYKAANPPKRGPANTSARVPSTHSPRTQTRNISESSTGSEVTFPRRPDAYLATDLSTPPSGDSSPPNAPPSLPYPALASAPRNGLNRASTMIASSSSSSGRSLTSSTSLNKSPGSFFASLGRKTSIKKDKGVALIAPVIGRALSKSPPRQEPNPRPVTIPNSPSVPGGPRAPPNRMQRSQTIVLSPQSPPNGLGHHRSSTVVIQRPSQLSGRHTFSERGSPADPDEFARQVDKLAALLPKADKAVLGGYLRRAGQDILAIGQYLEDEKNGTLRYD